MSMSAHLQQLSALNERLETHASRLYAVVEQLEGAFPTEVTAPSSPPPPYIHGQFAFQINQAHDFAGQLSSLISRLEDSIMGNKGKDGGGFATAAAPKAPY